MGGGSLAALRRALSVVRRYRIINFNIITATVVVIAGGATARFVSNPWRPFWFWLLIAGRLAALWTTTAALPLVPGLKIVIPRSVSGPLGGARSLNFTILVVIAIATSLVTRVVGIFWRKKSIKFLKINPHFFLSLHKKSFIELIIGKKNWLTCFIMRPLDCMTIVRGLKFINDQPQREYLLINISIRYAAVYRYFRILILCS